MSTDDEGPIRPELAELRARVAATLDAARPVASPADPADTRAWILRGLQSAAPAKTRERRFIDTW